MTETDIDAYPDGPTEKRLTHSGPGHALKPTPNLFLSKAWPILVIVAAVLIANSLYLLGFVSANPIVIFSDMFTITHSSILKGFPVTDPNAGYTAQALGHLAALDLLHGHIPWWNPYEGIGTPLAGEMQSAALFPPILLLAFSNGQLYFHIFLECASGIATYFLLLRLKISRGISTGAGIAFALNGTFAWFGHSPVNPIALLPLMLLGVERARSAAKSGVRHRWGLISIALALSLYAGFPEVAYLDALLVVIWTLARSAQLHRDELILFAKKISGGAVVGLFLAAPLLVAFGDFLPWANLGVHASGFNKLHLPASSSPQMLLPYSYGPVASFSSYDKTHVLGGTWGNAGGYITTSILVFAVISLYSRRLRPLRIGLAAWILVALGRTFGIPPFLHIFGFLPLMNSVAAYRYLPPSWEMAALVLAALGIDDLRRKAVPLWYIVTGLVGTTLVTIFIFFEGTSIRNAITEAPHVNFWVFTSYMWGLGMIALIGVVILATTGNARIGILLACLAIDVIAMFLVPDLEAPRAAQFESGAVVWLDHHLGDHRFYTLGPISPNFGSYFGLASVNINDAPSPKFYEKYITTKLDPNVDPSLFTGNNPLTPTGLSPLRALIVNMKYYETIGVKYVVAFQGFIPVATARKAHMELVYTSGGAYIFSLPKTAPLYTVKVGTCRLSNETVSSVVTDCKTASVIVRHELFMPGWSASASGNSIDVRRATSLYQEITVGPGTSNITFTFLPSHEDLAIACLIGGLALLIWGWWRGGIRISRDHSGGHAPAGARPVSRYIDTSPPIPTTETNFSLPSC